MQGIELSRRFYAEVVRPWLADAFPGLRHAAALIGSGSELLGFDDEMSRDHDWGPRVQLFVAEGDFERSAAMLVGMFAAAGPSTFLGSSVTAASQRHAQGTPCAHDDRHGLEVWTIPQALTYWLGGGEPGDNLAWLGLAEQRLLALTAGAVFHDDRGRLAAVRRRLAWFPRDVWLYKLACQWRRIAEEQAFVGRAGIVGDELGSRVIAARLARDVMRLALLVERRYAPYPKWLGSAFAELPCAAELTRDLARALAADTWKVREWALAESYATLGRLQQARSVPGAVAARIEPFHDRPFMVINAEEVIAGLRAQMADARLAALPIIGSLDQVSDSTVVTESPARARAAMAALLDDGEAGAVEEA